MRREPLRPGGARPGERAVQRRGLATAKGDAGSESGAQPGLGLSWLAVAWLMLSDVVGTSVLTFTGVARHLGYVLTVVFIAALFPLSLHVSVLMSRTRRLLLAQAEIDGTKAPLQLASMGDVARRALRSDRWGVAVTAVVYGYTLLGNASYLLVLGTSLQQSFPESGMCLYVAVAVACVVLAVPIFAVRGLGESVTLCLVNTGLIVAVIIVALYQISRQPARLCSEGASAFASTLSFLSAMGAMTNVLYSFAGQWMYFEIMDTMAKPSEFPKAFAVAGPFMVVTYLVVALSGLILDARGSDLLGSMTEGPELQAASALLFVHVVIVYLIKSIVLARFCLRVVAPHDLDARSKGSYLKFGGFGVAMLLFGFVVSNAVPFFSQLLGLIGGLLAGPINFVLPLGLFFAARKRLLASASSPAEQPPEQIGCSMHQAEQPPEQTGWSAHRVGDEDFEHEISEMSSETSSSPIDGAHDVRDAVGLCVLHAPDFALISITVSLTLCTMIFGVADVIKEIIELEGRYGAPFTCHALEWPDSAASCP